ncbi:MAG TPA: TlpA disulfide reductase family protein, partial [Chitinophagaceae bacterium]|nr:TlpA disulfide reductase family protein [Chitinophagaceae bacterium]
MKYFLMFIGGLTVVFSSLVLNAQDEQPMIGQPAPLFALKTSDGKVYSLEQLKGRYVVIHFAATWCPFCNAEAPSLEELYQNYRDKKVEVFIVDVREDKSLVQKLQ